MIGLAVCGMNGSGKSSTAKALSEELGLRLLDIEDYFFPPADPPLSVERKKAKSPVCFGATRKRERREPGFSGDRLSGSAAKGRF